MVVRQNRLLPLLLLPLALLLSACLADIDQTITFLADERWESTATLEFPAEAAALLGGQVDSQLAALQQEIELGGGRMSWERRDQDDGRFVYDIEAGGQGFDMLGDFVFMAMDVQPQVIDGQRQLVFIATPALDASSQTLTLIGGEILSSNGQVTGGDTVTWVNSTQTMQATLTERGGAGSRGVLGFALIGVGVLALLGLLAWFLMRRRGAAAAAAGGAAAWPPAYAPPDRPTDSGLPPPAPPALAAVAPPAGRFCVSCGASLRPTAKFCATCGHVQPD